MFLSRAITYKAKDGMLYSKSGIRQVLRSNLPARTYRIKSPAVNLAVENKFVVYNKALLDEPELDDRLADSLFCIWDIGQVKVCDPQTILIMRAFKQKILTEARTFNMRNLARKFLSKALPVDLRFKGYEVFGHAVDLDIRNGTNTYFNVIQLSSLFTAHIQKYRMLIDKLWFDPKHDEREHYGWIANLIESGTGNYRGFGSTGYFNDKRFIRILNAFLDANQLDRVKKVRPPVINARGLNL